MFLKLKYSGKDALKTYKTLASFFRLAKERDNLELEKWIKLRDYQCYVTMYGDIYILLKRDDELYLLYSGEEETFNSLNLPLETFERDEIQN